MTKFNEYDHIKVNASLHAVAEGVYWPCAYSTTYTLPKWTEQEMDFILMFTEGSRC